MAALIMTHKYSDSKEIALELNMDKTESANVIRKLNEQQGC
jgi:transcription initiation factor IIE alpha subunit